MSLVGTRPPTLDEWEKYEPHHRARMSFRPGLTGLWQVSGRSRLTNKYRCKLIGYDGKILYSSSCGIYKIDMEELETPIM